PHSVGAEVIGDVVQVQQRSRQTWIDQPSLVGADWCLNTDRVDKISWGQSGMQTRTSRETRFGRQPENAAKRMVTSEQLIEGLVGARNLLRVQNVHASRELGIGPDGDGGDDKSHGQWTCNPREVLCQVRTRRAR